MTYSISNHKCIFAEHLLYAPLCNELPTWKKTAYTTGYVFILVLTLTIVHLIYRFTNKRINELKTQNNKDNSISSAPETHETKKEIATETVSETLSTQKVKTNTATQPTTIQFSILNVVNTASSSIPKVYKKADTSILDRLAFYRSSISLNNLFSPEPGPFDDQEMSRTQVEFPQNTYLDLRIGQENQLNLNQVNSLQEIASTQFVKFIQNNPIPKGVFNLPEEVINILLKDMKRCSCDQLMILQVLTSAKTEINLNNLNNEYQQLTIDDFSHIKQPDTIEILILENSLLSLKTNEALPFKNLKTLKLYPKNYYTEQEFMQLVTFDSLETLSIGLNTQTLTVDSELFKNASKLKNLTLFINGDHQKVVLDIFNFCSQLEELTLYVFTPQRNNSEFINYLYPKTLKKLTIVFDHEENRTIKLENFHEHSSQKAPQDSIFLSLDSKNCLSKISTHSFGIGIWAKIESEVENLAYFEKLLQLYKYSSRLLSNLLARAIANISREFKHNLPALEKISSIVIKLSVEEITSLESNLMLFYALLNISPAQSPNINRKLSDFESMSKDLHQTDILESARFNLCTEYFLRLCLQGCIKKTGSPDEIDIDTNVAKKAEVIRRMIERNQPLFDHSLLLVQK